MDLHVDDGYATGPPENLQKVFTYLSTVLVLKISPLIMPGMSYNHVGTVRLMTEDGIWAKPFEKYIVEALDLMGMTHCKPSTSPKLDKSNMEGDDEPFHDAALYRTVTCKLIYPAKRRRDIQSTVRWLCKRLRNPDVKAGRQLTKLLRYLQGTKHLANYFPKEGAVDKIEGFCDGDWAGDEIDRKSVSGAAVVVGQCCLHSHSRGARTQSLSSGEQEIVSMSEILKDLLLIQFNLEFVGFGRLPIVIYTDASVAR